MEEVDFDPRLVTPFSCLIVGPSECGKSYFVKNVLQNCERSMDVVPDNVVWIYTCFQPMYAELQKMQKIKIKFVEGLPESFQDPDLFPPYHSHLVILDDVIFQASDHPDVEIFTQYRHHRNMSVMMLTQNVFHQGKFSRTISLNANYMILFKNPRDKLQIKTLAHQIFPMQKKIFFRKF